MKKKKKQGHHCRRHSYGRCLSDTSNRSYRPLIGAGDESAAAEGSSSHHRRTVSDFQLPPPAALDLEHSSVVKSFKKESVAGFPAISPAAKSSKLLMPHYSVQLVHTT
ncbi:unnamed protein product [Cuscuta campestris]|uniref:Uncharacterized protein n=1 Tax=Cuscuta campestris TaxID=132261 RepID=A0A484LQM0_9ASTE|nr:unnamed protein product [Cuscuta campestris]